MNTEIIRFLPINIRSKVRRILFSISGDTVSQGYENYAKKFKPQPGINLGDEWNEPEVIGMDVAPDKIVSTLDQTIFQPFLGNCGVILEIGPGGGRFTEILLLKCQKVIAADTSPTMLTLLKKRFDHNPKLECIQLDGLGLNAIPDNSIDAVFSYDVFNHLEPWDIYNYLSEIKRVLIAEGKAVIHYSNTFSDLGWKRFLSDIPQQLNIPKAWGSMSLMTPEVFREFATRAGLQHNAIISNVVRRDCISLLYSTYS